MTGVSKLSGSHKCWAMLTKLLILAVSVSTCVAIANAIDDDDYGEESRDVSLRGHHQQQQQQQQQAFNFDNLQRLRAKFQQDAHYRKNKARNGGNNNRNLYRAAGGGRLGSDGAASRDEDRNSNQKNQNQNQNQNQNDNQPKFNEMEFYDELESSLPYGIQNVRRDLTSRSTRSQMHLHKPKTTFQSLCPSRRTVIPLETVSYEYRPDHYEEVTCFHSYAPSRDYMSETNKVCSEAGFTCIQLNRTVYLTRRAKGTECWESETRIVPSGCECMWPKHTFGDIITYH